MCYSIYLWYVIQHSNIIQLSVSTVGRGITEHMKHFFITTYKPKLSQEIMAHLYILEHDAMFRASCFGSYVNMSMGVECHSLLCYNLKCKDVTSYPRVELEELLFLVHDYRVFIGMRVLCLITVLGFGEYFQVTLRHSLDNICLGFRVSERY